MTVCIITAPSAEAAEKAVTFARRLQEYCGEQHKGLCYHATDGPDWLQESLRRAGSDPSLAIVTDEGIGHDTVIAGLLADKIGYDERHLDRLPQLATAS